MITYELPISWYENDRDHKVQMAIINCFMWGACIVIILFRPEPLEPYRDNWGVLMIGLAALNIVMQLSEVWRSHRRLKNRKAEDAVETVAFKEGHEAYFTRAKYGCFEGKGGFSRRYEDAQKTPYPAGSIRALSWTQGFLSKSGTLPT